MVNELYIHRINAVLVLLALAVALFGNVLLPQQHPGSRPSGISLTSALSDDPGLAGFARADAARVFVFPEDHGPHPDFRTEWWYFTGNLHTAEGRRLGYQLTFFRIGLSPIAPDQDSLWRTQAIYMAHFALSDPSGKRFHAYERFSREAKTLGLAGAEAKPFAVFLDDWSARGTSTTWPMTLKAASGEIAIELTLEPLKPIVLQGEAGLSQKSADAGNASYYYSVPRLATKGMVRIGGTRHTVVGQSWLDREWSTSALAANQSGWDWFALQLQSGDELMIYRLRRQDGSLDPASAGSWITAAGRTEHLSAADFHIQEQATWQSPTSGIRYPGAWQVRVPRLGLDLHVAPVMADQELRLGITYWEGAVDVRGEQHGQAVLGEGYVELAGYTQ